MEDKSYRFKYYDNENKYLNKYEIYNPPNLPNYSNNILNNPPNISNNHPNILNNPPNISNNHPNIFNNPPNISNNHPNIFNNPPNIFNNIPNTNNISKNKDLLNQNIDMINSTQKKNNHKNQKDNNLLNTLFNFMTPFSIIIENENENVTDKNNNETQQKSKKQLIKLEREKLSKYKFETIDRNIENINDLIQLGSEYNDKYKNKKKLYPIDLKILNELVEPLTELKNMIGLDDIKKQIFEQIIFYLQNLDDQNYDMLHTVIYGDPGIGKTELAKILAKIYSKLGILSKGSFLSVKRSDLIGGYLGQTAMKTKKVLDDAKGGVLFIDEAYSLGNKDGKDSYSKECIDTLTAALTEEKDDLIVIIAGYKDDLQKCFFAQNNGLERRFNWRFEINKYNAEELRKIFIKKANDQNWNILSDNDIPISFFEDNLDLFYYNGGDMETLFQKCKMAHSYRVLTLPPKEKKNINKIDLEKGLEFFLESRKNNKNNHSLENMYS